ncbi:MAG: hypothetical protein HY043_11035 [Verrucomicrobia bacterium]|nr:hypothetical protein [Verrucomicrobiota bacterium]
MLRFLKNSLTALVLAAAVQQAPAFSLNGATPAWQIPGIGYTWTTDGAVLTIGGVMNLGEEYRWNLPVIFYAVDSSFLNFFGARGVEEIDKAVKILNDLPPVSQVNIDDYPLKSQRINYQAQALGLVDIKTAALQSLVQEIGLADPEDFVFTLRSRTTPVPTVTNYYVFQRNFDPVTLRPTAYINGDLWTYVGMADNQNAPIAYPIKSRVDPLSYGDPVASSESSQANNSSVVGLFYTGLTRDDVGGLRYIYHPLNKNMENPAPNVFSGLGGVIAGLGGSAVTGSPWEPLFLSSSNGTTTTVSGGAFGNSPFAPVFIPNSNNVATAAGGGTGGAVLNTNNFINTGLRSGIDKLRFVRVQYDSILGQFVSPVLTSFQDSIITNGIQVTQTLQRIITQPDILFTAADLNAIAPFDFLRVYRNQTFTNNAAINQQAIGGVPVAVGPGTINPGVIITFNNAIPSYLAVFAGAGASFLSEDNPAAKFPIWASFDGTTNAPVIYPNNVSIEEIERQVLGGR